MNNNIRFTIAQQNFWVGNIPYNVAKIIQATAHAQQVENADWVIFPELALTGYPPEDLLFRDDFLEAAEKGLLEICQSLPNSRLIVGYPQRVGKKLYNAAAIIENGHIACVAQKQYLPNYGVFDEKRYFQAGSQSCVLNLSGIPTAVMICEDIWRKNPLNNAARAGAQMAIVLNASPFSQQKPQEREAVLHARVMNTRIPILYAHGVGGQDELIFDGGSFAMNSKGNVVLEAPCFKEAFITLSVKKTEDQNIQWVSTGLERPIADNGTLAKVKKEQNIAKLYDALVLATHDYVIKNRFPGALMGLSGGIDSALTLAIAVDALGHEKVKVLLMPSRYSAQMSTQDAIEQAESMHVTYQILSIEPMYLAALATLEPEFRGYSPNVAEENLQARIRGQLLMAVSNKTGRIVLTTGNKSEMAVGYATLYGDMAGGFAVLKDVLKTQVYALARYRNTIQSVIPERVFTRAPSAELAIDQKDQDTLPPYEILDEILTRYIEHDASVAELVQAGFAPDIVKKVINMVDKNEYKRRQSPPGPRVTRRAFGRDRRYPITSGFTPIVFE